MERLFVEKMAAETMEVSDLADIKLTFPSKSEPCDQDLISDVVEKSLDDREEKGYGLYMKVWNVLDEQDAIVNARPLYQQIPHFKGMDVCTTRLLETDIIKESKVVYCDLDKSLNTARLELLLAGKTILLPRFRSTQHLLCKYEPREGATRSSILADLKHERGRMMEIDESLHIDVLLISSVAVSSTGKRLGRADLYTEMFPIMLRCLGLIDDTTKIITLVHDLQLVDIPLKVKATQPADCVITPTQTITCSPGPRNVTDKIEWNNTSQKVLDKVPFLNALRYRDYQAGRDVSLQGESMSEEVLAEAMEKLKVAKIKVNGGTRRRRIRKSDQRTKKHSTDDSGHSTHSPGTSQERTTAPAIETQAHIAGESTDEGGKDRDERYPRKSFRRSRRTRSKKSAGKTSGSVQRENSRKGERVEREKSSPTKYPSSTTTLSQDGRPLQRSRRMNIVLSRRTKVPLSDMPCLYLGGLARRMRNWELRQMIKDCSVKPTRIIRPVFGAYAFLYFSTMEELNSAEAALEDLKGENKDLRIELGRRSQPKQQSQQLTTAANGSAGEDEEEEPAVI